MTHQYCLLPGSRVILGPKDYEKGFKPESSGGSQLLFVPSRRRLLSGRPEAAGSGTGEVVALAGHRVGAHRRVAHVKRRVLVVVPDGITGVGPRTQCAHHRRRVGVPQGLADGRGLLICRVHHLQGVHDRGGDLGAVGGRVLRGRHDRGRHGAHRGHHHGLVVTGLISGHRTARAEQQDGGHQSQSDAHQAPGSSDTIHGFPP